MKGIQFVVDDKGEKTAVLIDLQEYGELWEDFYDCLIARGRADEPCESLAEVREQLRHNKGNYMDEYALRFARAARRELEALAMEMVRG